jgi:hypothetical protein
MEYMYESLVPSAEMRGAYAVMWKLIRVCESYVLRNDVDAHPLPSELERVCESCLVPSSRNENTGRSDADAHFLPDDLERVCESCLVPSLPSKIKEINAGELFRMFTAYDVDAHSLPDDLERVCASCLGPCNKKTEMMSFYANLFPMR